MISKLLSIYLQLFFCNGADIIVYPTVRPNWTSTTFLIPTQTPDRSVWPVCSKQSKFYCLYAYEVDENTDKPALEMGVSNYGVQPLFQMESYTKLSVLIRSALSAAEKVFLPIYQKQNFFVEYDGCCVGQYNTYYRYGLQTLKFTPEFYADKMTDFSEDNKILNLIHSFLLENCDTNIVTKLGFGEGRLVRNQYKSGLSSHRSGGVFSLVGTKFTKILSR